MSNEVTPPSRIADTEALPAYIPLRRGKPVKVHLDPIKEAVKAELRCPLEKLGFCSLKFTFDNLTQGYLQVGAECYDICCPAQPERASQMPLPLTQDERLKIDINLDGEYWLFNPARHG